MSYQIKMVSEMLGIPKSTLIAWERRYDIVDPSRTGAGYRLYSEEEVGRLRRVQELLEQGYKVGEACRLVVDGEVLRRPVGAAALPATEQAALAVVKDELKACLLAFDRASADEIVGRLVMVRFEQVLDEVYAPLLHEVGQAWEAGRVDVVQEHFASAYCREKLLVLLHSVQGASTAPEVTCATLEGEHHELGLLAVALRLAVRGFRILYLGPNVPTEALITHVNARAPAALCLSMVRVRPHEELLEQARELRARIRPAIAIAIGGRAAEDEVLRASGLGFVGHRLPPWLQSVDELRASQRRG